MKLAKIWYLLAIMIWMSAFLVSCKKDKPEISNIPIISIQSVSPAGNIKEFTDSVTLIIAYEDGDGDLGENSTTAKNLFITDSRIGVTESFRISELAPSGASIHIKGTLRLVRKNIPITNGNSSEQFTYNVYVKDRAGNQSNTVSSPAITVVK
ncbi:MAG: hypothetical protein IPO27_12135 [Bacteroidetes bacterium]|nr:hypothetical protein [Bacteroidota bacterium]